MKLATIAAILGVASAIDIAPKVEEPEQNLVQEYDADLQELLDQDIDTGDSEELIDAEEGEEGHVKECRTQYMLKEASESTTLGVRKIRRCIVKGTTSNTIYMWKNKENCDFLGGQLGYHYHKFVKSGKPNHWQRVQKCVMKKTFKTDTVKQATFIRGMQMGKCYKFRSYYAKKGYLSNVKTWAYNSKSSKTNIWRIDGGIDGTKNSITLRDRTNRYGMMLYGKDRVRFYWNRYLKKNKASFYVVNGLAGKGVSLMPTKKKNYFLKNSSHKYRGSTQLKAKKYVKRWSFKAHATFIPIKAKC